MTFGWQGVFIIFVFFLKTFESFQEKFEMEDVLYFWEFFFKSKEYWDGFVGDLSQEKYSKFGHDAQEIKTNGNKLMQDFNLG